MALAVVSFSSNAGGAETEYTSKLDPCTLISKEEAAKIIGELPEAPKADAGPRERDCHYTNAAGAWLKVSLYSSARWGMQKGIVSELNPTDLPGLGEEAFAVRRGTTYEIWIRKGNCILEISSTVGAQATERFAERAAQQLP
jgi:hypothetical protein